MALFALPDNITPQAAPSADQVQGIIDSIKVLRNPLGPVTFGLTTLSTTSATYVDVPNTIDTYTKVGSATESDLIVYLAISCFVGSANTKPMFGIHIGSTDYDVVQMLINPANKHTQISGIARFTGVASGAIGNTNIRVKKISGSGPIQTDTNDFYTKCFLEIPII